MAEQNNNRSSSAAAGAAGLASDNQNLVDDATVLTTMYQDIFHQDKEEDVGGAKSLLSLSRKSSLKKTTKAPKQPAATPRGMLWFKSE